MMRTNRYLMEHFLFLLIGLEKFTAENMGTQRLRRAFTMIHHDLSEID